VTVPSASTTPVPAASLGATPAAGAAAPSRRGWAALAGVLAVGAALATGELAAGIVEGVPSPLVAIGQVIVDYQPPGAKDFVVALFGTNDKLALQVFVAVVALAIGALLGLQALRRPGLGTTVIGLFAAAGFLASLRDVSDIPVFSGVAAGAETIVGSWALSWLLAGALRRPATSGTERQGTSNHRASGRPTPGGPTPRAVRRVPKASPAGAMPDWTRRTLLQRGGAVAVGSIAAATLGRWLLARSRAPAPAGSIPSVATPANLPPGADLSSADLTSAGLTPIVMPNDRFYRIDTALIPPSVDAGTWTLRIHGMVDREIVLTYDQLKAMPIIEQYVTIACVSNEVGGDLVGNAAWRGVDLRSVLAMAGVQAGATQLVGRSVDGFTVGMPTEWVMDKSRTPMIAIAMNGQPLPQLHGYPARLIVPGLYGYVSATKWLSELELTTLEAFDAYWVALGWAKEAPILTQSRIDVPHDGASVPVGRVAIAGVAWAPDRGVAKVEVSVDQGSWQAATLSAPISKATWVQWMLPWDAGAGDHSIQVRATDGTGMLQANSSTPPFPDGARGYHQVSVHAG
jgi:DMSO/TMAO reductase YedYZ molybdopterin-dependent catalytic subunit